MSAVSSDDHIRTYDFGLRALAQVKRHQTSAEPIAYELWYEHVTGHHRKLSAEVKARIAEGRLTDSDIRELHANYLSSLRVSDRLGEIGAGAQIEVGALIDAVRAALGELAKMDSDLSETADKLEQTDVTAASLGPLLAVVLATTRGISGTNRALQSRLNDSQASISSLQAALEAARGEAMTDSLTSLFNRRAFDEQLKARFARSTTEQLPLTLLMLDIDHFKSFNDRHGHSVGDQVIRLVGSCIKQRLEAPDMPARYGGEEFAIIGLGRSRENASEVAEDIRRRIHGYEIVEQGTQRSIGKITVSIGVASRRPDDTPSSLLDRADSCLHEAKRGGRNRVETDLTADAWDLAGRPQAYLAPADEARHPVRTGPASRPAPE